MGEDLETDEDGEEGGEEDGDGEEDPMVSDHLHGCNLCHQ